MNDPLLELAIVVAAYLTIASAVVVWRHGGEEPPQAATAPESEGPGVGHKHARKPKAQGDIAASAQHPAPTDADRLRVGRFLRLIGTYAAGLAATALVAAALQPVLGPLVPSVMPADQHRAALALALGWSLVAINVVVAWHLVGALLPPGRPGMGGPGTMGGRIGMLERGLVVMLTLSGGPGSIGFVIAAKTLARFKELDDQDFAERYLLGTLASVTIALASALAAQVVWNNAA